ncbi:MAG: diaminopimelate epimerase [Cryomorphaceae bacterium]|nr:MAG: diaminopimelate epimerase [Cryomorphaceae bacterium]
MELAFEKYQGTGNDFIIIENRSKSFPVHDVNVIQWLCHRRFGIGSDGLILIEPDEVADFYMNFFNPDGSQSYCGNGSRCAVLFAHSHGWVGNRCSFRAIDGMHQGFVDDNGWIRISMNPVASCVENNSDFQLNTGSPHYIRFTGDVEHADLIDVGRSIRYNDTFREKGINVNLVQELAEGILRMRTYERGVEDETLSCGTGVTAAALAYRLKSNFQDEVIVQTKGGELKVQADADDNRGFHNIWLSGPARKVFSGFVETKHYHDSN